MLELYPELDEFKSYELNQNGHLIYFEECGNTKGTPVIFLHGGPGSGCNENHRRYFNPKKYRIILLDQRGCNRSTPNGSIHQNTTQDILADIETIRKKLSIDKWLLFGGSWGATLALLYAEEYPENISGMILRGTFLARACDISWFLNDGVNRVFPDYWQEFISLFNENEKANLLDALHQRIFSDDIEMQLETARAWSLWAGRVVTHTLNEDYVLDDENEEKLINDVRIEIHFARNNYFIKEDQILQNISKLPNITIIHGEKDLTCLPESSLLLHQALPSSRLEIVKNAGHLASEPAMINALVKATDKMLSILG